MKEKELKKRIIELQKFIGCKIINKSIKEENPFEYKILKILLNSTKDKIEVHYGNPTNVKHHIKNPQEFMLLEEDFVKTFEVIVEENEKDNPIIDFDEALKHANQLKHQVVINKIDPKQKIKIYGYTANYSAKELFINYREIHQDNTLSEKEYPIHYTDFIQLWDASEFVPLKDEKVMHPNKLIRTFSDAVDFVKSIVERTFCQKFSKENKIKIVGWKANYETKIILLDTQIVEKDGKTIPVNTPMTFYEFMITYKTDQIVENLEKYHPKEKDPKQVKNKPNEFRAVIHFHSGATIIRDRVTEISKKGNTVHLAFTGYTGDIGTGMFHDIAGYETYRKAVKNDA